MAEEFVEGTAKIIKEENTFFNPAQKLNRDISIEVINSYFAGRDNIRILTAMEATGLRAIRYLNEVPNCQLFLNDICPNAIETMQLNLKHNGFNDYRLVSETDNLRTSIDRINVVLSDCQVLMNKYHGYFDVIDIDPFGSSAEFVNSAFKAIKHNGLIFFTCTDKAALCTNTRKCYMKYNTAIKKLYCKNETPIRTLLSYISREFAKYDAMIVPILSLSVDFYVRVAVRVFKGQGKTVLENNSFLNICDCFNKKEVGIFDSADSMCQECNKKMKLYGPFWNKALHDPKVIKSILENISNENERMVGILRLMDQEIPDMFYYEMPEISSVLKTNCCKLRDAMNALANLGFKVSLTHCDNNSFKTNAPISVIKDILISFNKGENKYSKENNPEVDKILNESYHKGKLASGLRPLSLPKK